MSDKELEEAKEYKGIDGFVLETTHGYYGDYGWGFASSFADLSKAKEACEFFSSKGAQYRVVSNGKVVYQPNQE